MLPFQQGLQETAIAAALLLVASPVHPFLLELECWGGQEQWQVTQSEDVQARRKLQAVQPRAHAVHTVDNAVYEHFRPKFDACILPGSDTPEERTLLRYSDKLCTQCWMLAGLIVLFARIFSWTDSGAPAFPCL